MTLSAAVLTRLEKAAVDNGFDQERQDEGEWLGFGSTQAPLRIWLTAVGDAVFRVAFSHQNVFHALADHGASVTNPLPVGARGARAVEDIPALHRLVRRAFQLSRALPDELLHVFEKETAPLPRDTEIERLIVQRVGQDIFRAGLLEYWEGRCAVSGLGVRRLLRASHIKPWAECTTDAERLDVFNGLLLAPDLDALFDEGMITFDDDGETIVSRALSEEDRALLRPLHPARLREIAAGHRHYLAWHRAHVFESSDAAPSGRTS